MKKILLIALLLASCQAGDGKQYDTTSKAKWSTTTIAIHWGTKEETNDVCTSLGTSDGSGDAYNGCAQSNPKNVDICDVYVVQPTDFDDEEALKALGHETWHCLGATHK
jgi:hypothetical protein